MMYRVPWMNALASSNWSKTPTKRKSSPQESLCGLPFQIPDTYSRFHAIPRERPQGIFPKTSDPQRKPLPTLVSQRLECRLQVTTPLAKVHGAHHLQKHFLNTTPLCNFSAVTDTLNGVTDVGHPTHFQKHSLNTTPLGTILSRYGHTQRSNWRRAPNSI